MVEFCGNWQPRQARALGMRIEVFLRGEVCLIFAGKFWTMRLRIAI